MNTKTQFTLAALKDQVRRMRSERHALQAEGKHPAPCARFCEATAFRIEIRGLEAENARMRSELERPMSSEATVLVHDNARLRAELEALRGAVPAGWKLVPTEPSDEWISRLDAQQTGDLEEVDADAIRQCIVELLAAAPQPAAHQTVVWPKSKDVGRYGDMSPSAHMRVGLDSDNDAYVSVWDEHGGGYVEFCNGGSGGGSSMKTRLALIDLMVAMEEDNAARPDKDWWARRATALKKGEKQ
jgi:hypothetical protein